MSSNERILNFSAGPAVLPEKVIKKLQKDLWNIKNSGIGIMEHSHRGPLFSEIIDKAKKRIQKLGEIPDNFEILFLQGGASLQFSMIPMNYLTKELSADYANTGTWSGKAIEAAKLHGKINTIFNGYKQNFKETPLPNSINCTTSSSYFYYCSNNTIYGTRWTWTPSHPNAVIADMSSEIFSRKINWEKHDLVFACAQKNLGPSGVVLVIIDKDFLKKSNSKLPPMLRYDLHAEKNSCYNTPPTFGIHALSEICEWIIGEGGISTIEEKNELKSSMIYEAIDTSNGFYTSHSTVDSRSRMNIVFKTPSKELDLSFLEEAQIKGMTGLKGHRSIGGLRASIYNAFPEDGCQRLVSFMKTFKGKN